MGCHSGQFVISKRRCMRALVLVALVCSGASTRSNNAHSVHLGSPRTAFVQTQYRNGSGKILTPPGIRYTSPSMTTCCNMANNDEEEDEQKSLLGFDVSRNNNPVPGFLDAMLEIPDPRLLAGDLLFILMINFLLQIANEVGDPAFWLNGGFSQPVTMPTTLLAVIVRDSKMSLAWVLGALWNRSYSSSSVSDDETAIKIALQVWVDYCSLRILLELGESFLFTHSSINIWMLGREAWYTAIIMAFFRLAYGRFR